MLTFGVTFRRAGPTSVESEFVGWFVNGSYSVYIWGQEKHLRLGFGKEAGADPALDDVLVAVRYWLVRVLGGH